MEKSFLKKEEKPVLLFDGICNLCNNTVQFIIRHDPEAKIQFASLQSEAGRQLLLQSNIPLPPSVPNTIILVYKGQYYTKSEAALRILKMLERPYSLFYYPLSFFPLWFRNRIYDQVSKNRYRWFGKQEFCMMPTPELKARFLPEPDSFFY